MVDSAPYLQTLAAIERANYQLHMVVQEELRVKGWGHLNAAQALLVYHLGDQVLSMLQLRQRSCYLGTNASYTVGKLCELGLVLHESSRTDRRAVRISVTAKGKEVRAIVV